MAFDIRTLILLNFIVNCINAGTMVVIWRQYRGRFAGTSCWLVGMILPVLGVGMILLRGRIPDFMAIVLSNTLMLAGAVLLLIGLERYTGARGPQVQNYLLMAVYFCLTLYFYLVQPDMTLREIVISSMIMILYGQICWLLLRRAPSGLRPMTRICGVVMGGYVLASLLRIILLVTIPVNTSDFFKSGVGDALAVTLYLSLHICFIIALVLMVTRRLLDEVHTQEEKYTKAFHSSPNAILLTRQADGEILEVNDGFVNISGYSAAEALGKKTRDLSLWVVGEEREAVKSALARKTMVQGVEMQFRKKSGELINGLYSADVIEINGEKFILSSISDITELSQMKQKLQEMATHDSLTGLPNRVLFYDRFEIALANAQRQKQKLAILSLDLDNFKTTNDTFGHATGDKVLVEAAGRLAGALRRVDTVARFGGDEFVILLWDIEQAEDAVTVAEKILEGFHRPYTIDGQVFQLNGSIGIALYPQHGEDLQTLIERSDQAMYRAKESGRGRVYLAAGA